MSRMRTLTESEFRGEALSSLRQIFDTDDPFGTPIAQGVQARAIWYPVGFRLEPAQLEAVVAAASREGDRAMYLSILERPPDYAQDWPYHWFLPFEELAAYESLGHAFVLENVLYSCSGKWGVMISHEDHAVVGGSRDFVSRLFAGLRSSPQENAERFVRYWQDLNEGVDARREWLPTLLNNVFGPEQSSSLLQRLQRGDG